MPAQPRPVVEIFLGDRLTLSRTHPCGGSSWQVVRVGADIGLVCETCGRRVLLERRQLERRLVSFLERGDGTNTAAGDDVGDDGDDA